MNQRRHHHASVASPRQGFTLLEFIVAMVVFGIALVGMLPLVVILSRDIRPIKSASSPSGYYRTPARDWENGSTWYVLPFEEPWARKLGASARITADNDAFATYAPISVGPSLMSHDDDTDATDSDGDGLEDYVDAAADSNWQTGARTAASEERQDYRYHSSLETAPAFATATWSFTIATAGYYSLQATWPTDTGMTLTTVAYAVTLNGAAVAGSPFSVNQNTVSSGIADTSGTWYPIATDLLYLTPGTVQVQLQAPVTGSTDSMVLADGVRLVPSNDITVITLTRTPNSETVTTDVLATVRIPK